MQKLKGEHPCRSAVSIKLHATFLKWTCSKGRIVNIQKCPIWYICNNFKFLQQISMKFCKKFDNHVINPTPKIFSWKSKLLNGIDKKVTLLLSYQFSCFIKDFSYSKVKILFFVNIWSQKWHQTREAILFQERYRITK